MDPEGRQARAEKLAERFVQAKKRPIVIEFAGMPKAGKTSTINQLNSFLRRCGFKVEVVVERASICPIRDKKHANFNVWTACTTLAQVLEKTQDPPRPEDPHVLVLDRGIFDSICWLSFMEKLARLRRSEREQIEAFLSISDWRRRITGVILMTVTPEDALVRERGHLPVRTTGSIMNADVLRSMRETVEETRERLHRDFRIFQVDTSRGGTNKNERRTAEEVADLVLNLIEEQLEERVLFLPKQAVTAAFSGSSTISGASAQSLRSLFSGEGRFAPREEVEADSGAVQALPVVVVRNRSGEVLRLRRRESSPEHSLHEKLVIWAGGHVREEDSEGGDAVLTGALREIQEELRLRLRPDELTFLGATYVDPGTKVSQHVALVFQWQAPTDHVAIALSSSEFFERRGNSSSGQFVPTKKLFQELSEGKTFEVWSREILTSLLPEGSEHRPLTLF